jgi:hypothetical protein
VNGGPIGPKKTTTRYRWQIPVDEARAVAEAMLAAADLATDALPATHLTVNLDEIIARVAPNAKKVAFEAPAAVDVGEGHPHYLWDTGFTDPRDHP